MSGGVTLSARNKQRFLSRLQAVKVVDIVGSSESGRQGVHTSSVSTGADSGRFVASAGSTVLDETRSTELRPGSAEIGWLAASGSVPLGYLGDAARTTATFPVVGGVRYAVAGDRARRADDGTIELLGRDSVTINTGGEKVFAEEVEHALKAHPAVFDALVVGRPSQRWGAEVVAVVSLRPGLHVTDSELLTTAGEHLARFKLPKLIVRRAHLQRSASGKPDYGWAREQLDGP
jgi:fatty-acyl-CoA synthase